MTRVQLSQELMEQFQDMKVLYAEARQSGASDEMKKLTQLIGSLAKQIRDHETHERKTVTVEEATAYVQQFTAIVCEILSNVPDKDLSRDLRNRVLNALTAYTLVDSTDG